MKLLIASNNKGKLKEIQQIRRQLLSRDRNAKGYRSYFRRRGKWADFFGKCPVEGPCVRKSSQNGCPGR